MKYTIVFSDIARDHLRRMTAYERTKVVATISQQLSAQPFMKSRNRKPLRANPIAPWELRVGKQRVFFGANADDQTVVEVLAIGEKRGNAVFIDGVEVEL